MNSKLGLQKFKVFFIVQGLFALLLTAPGKAAATTTVDIKDTNYPPPSGAYFVSPDGNDSNSGMSANSPWTVAKAIQLAPSGSTIVFRGGTYRNVQATIKKKLTLQPYPHEKAWIKGSIVVTDWVADGAIWRKNDWIYSFPQVVNNNFIDERYPLADNRDMVYVNGVSLKQVASKAEVGPGRFYVDYANKQLYIGDNPSGKTVESTALKQAFTIWKAGSADPSETVVRGLGIAHYADMGLRLGAPRLTLENNTVAWNGVTGAWFYEKMDTTLGISSDAIVRGNTFSYNGSKGLGGSRAHRILLEDNKISYNNVENYATDWDAAGVKFVKTDKLLWRNNLVEYNNGNGMWIDISSTNATVVHNVSRYNVHTNAIGGKDGIGIFFEISHKAIIAGNLVYKNGYAGIMLSNSSSARVYNNTIANNNTNLKVKDTTRNNTDANEINQGITWIARNHEFKNNILSNTSGGSLFDASNCSTKEESALMVAAANRNAYYRQVSTLPQSVVKWSVNSKNCAVEYKTVASFAATGYETQALVMDNVATNPFFINEASGDYRLKPGSEAIGRGEALTEEIANAMGVASGVPLDLGAVQANVLLGMSQ